MFLLLQFKLLLLALIFYINSEKLLLKISLVHKFNFFNLYKMVGANQYWKYFRLLYASSCQNCIERRKDQRKDI